MRSPDNRIDGAGISAMHTADTQGLIDNGDRRLNPFDQRHGFPAQEVSKAPYRGFATWWTEINRCGAVDDSLRIGAATGISTLRALRLRQQVIELFHKIVGVGGQPP